MSEDYDPVVEAALSLTSEERLLESLQAEHGAELDPDEIEDRIDALRRGDSAWLGSHVSAGR